MNKTPSIPFGLTIRDMHSREVRIATPTEQREFNAQRKFNKFPVPVLAETVSPLGEKPRTRSNATAQESTKTGVEIRQTLAAGIDYGDPGDPFLALAFVMATVSAFALGWMLCDIWSK